jgi:hypothetical protein
MSFASFQISHRYLIRPADSETLQIDKKPQAESLEDLR